MYDENDENAEIVIFKLKYFFINSKLNILYANKYFKNFLS